MNIKNLILSCKENDRTAQKKLYGLYVKLLMGIAIRYVSDVPSAKDIVQETMLRFFKSIDKLDFENKKALDAYLRKITVREALRWLNKTNLIDYDENIKRIDTSIPNDGVSIVNQKSLLQDIKGLPIKYRTIFNLYAIDGYSHKEIAEKLNIEASTSRSQLTRARAILKERITKKSNYVRKIQ